MFSGLGLMLGPPIGGALFEVIFQTRRTLTPSFRFI